jgi:hypothetical protein
VSHARRESGNSSPVRASPTRRPDLPTCKNGSRPRNVG